MKQNLPFLKHILEEINFLLKETEGLSYENFCANEVLKRACVRSMEIIGEAAKNISDDLREKHKEVDWKKLAGMRDKIVHYYFGVNWDIVWAAIQEKIPELKSKIEAIIKQIENKG
jgi:uncharacterized protein with HEPN domain